MTIDKEGICLTCAHTPKCALTSENCASNGTHFCEEYETFPLAADSRSKVRPSKRVNPQYHPGILGLCSNCAHYPYCSFPKPEAGVWHCEDYQ
jgi:hypothetical protein